MHKFKIVWIRALARAVAVLLGAGVASVSAQQSLAVGELDGWQWVAPSRDGSVLTARHEAASVVIGDAIYLIGGRQNRPVERYATSTGVWENLGLAPLELHHFQPVVLGTSIYIIGAFTCCYPREQAVADIHVFDSVTATWSVAGSMPASRVRGSTAATVHEGKIYILGGNTQGHDGGAVAWFDEFDPATGEWRELPDAPEARDHFSAALIDNTLVAAAGRQTRLPNPSANPVMQTDMYDFATTQWTSGADIRTARAGAVAVTHGHEVIVAGGEINTASAALDVVEAFDTQTGIWRTLPSMNSGRHGSGGGIVDRRLFMLSGASSLGGATETTTSEFLILPELVADPAEADNRANGGAAGFWFMATAGFWLSVRRRFANRCCTQS